MYVFNIFIILLLVSCGSGPNNLPKRPSIDACKIIMQENIAYCVNNQTGYDYDIDVNKLDRYVAFSEDHYQMLLLYIKLLQRFTPKRVTKQLNSFHWIETMHQWKVKEVKNGRNP